MEEDITNNAEFPDNGVFDLGHMPGSKYKDCTWRISGTIGWCRKCYVSSLCCLWTCSNEWPWMGATTARPWVINLVQVMLCFERSHSCLKRTIPYISLATDSSGSMCVDSIVSNVYINISDDVYTQAILSDIAAKIGTDKDLTLLNSKFVPVTDDKGLYSFFFLFYLLGYMPNLILYMTL